MTTLRALARVVVAGVAYVVAAVRHWFEVERAFSEMSIRIARRRMEDQQRKARAAGYRGPIDPGGRWLEDLAAGRIDHNGNPLPYQET